MAKIIDKEIKSISTPWQGYRGGRVEEFIKAYIAKLDSDKFGFLNVESGASGLQTMRFFANENSFTEWFSDKERYADNVLKEFSFYSNKPEDTYTMRCVVTRYPATTMARGAQNSFSLSYNCYWGDNPQEKDSSNGVATVEINGVAIPQLTTTLKPSAEAKPNVYNFDLSEFIKSETNKVKVVVQNEHEQRREFVFNINCYDIKLEFDKAYDESVIQTSSWALRVNVRGVEATVYCQVENSDKIELLTKTINNSSGEFIIDEQNNYLLGAHNIVVWAENKQLGIETRKLTTTYIKGASGANGEPALSLGRGSTAKAKLFSVVSVP